MEAEPHPPAEVRPCRILIVDDEVDVTGVFSLLLDLHGYTVTCASNGQEGLASAFEAPPDLVLTDLMMPTMNGLEMARALRADARTAAIPIVLMSGAPGRLSGTDMQFDSVLNKPVRFERLLETIRKHLHR
jgi:CheY-like chemotaxis protein